MTHADLLATIERLFVEHGAARYELNDAEGVSQLEHALQCATHAAHAGADDELVAAALLHDIGHLIYNPAEFALDTENDYHETRGAAFLALLGPAVIEPIRLHVDAKRYLCTIEPCYFDALSEGSKQSLAFQGGPFSVVDAEAFLDRAHAAQAILLRRWDERSKVKGESTPPLSQYLHVVERSLLHAFVPVPA